MKIRPIIAECPYDIFMSTPCILIKRRSRSKLYKLGALIKNKNKGHKVKESKILEKGHSVTFLETAPDSTFLMIKV